MISFLASFFASMCIIHALAGPVYQTQKNGQIQMDLKRRKTELSQLENKRNVKVTSSNSCKCKKLKIKCLKNKYSKDLQEKKGKLSKLKNKSQNKTKRKKRENKQKCRLKSKMCEEGCVTKKTKGKPRKFHEKRRKLERGGALMYLKR